MSRLAPIERPRSLLIRLAYWLSRRRLGVTIAPLRVVYARLPGLARPQHALLRLAEQGLSLPTRLRMLVEIHVSLRNGCSFCSDLHMAMALEAGLEPGDVAALDEPQAHPERFSPLERAALAWALAVAHRTTSDELFERLRAELPDERALVELTWLAAMTTYLNTMAAALDLEADGLCAVRAPTLTLPRPAQAHAH